MAALALIVAFGGGAVALIKVADHQNADRSARGSAGGSGVSPGNGATTEPSAGLDREPNAPPPPTTATTVKPAPASTGPPGEGVPVVLKGDGIGAFIFGAKPDQVIAGLTLRWGPPDGDTGWVPAGTTAYGACPGNVARAVNWRGFAVLFSDGATPRGPAGVRHFFTWEYQVDDPNHPALDKGGNRPALKTANGVTVGVTVAKLAQVYGQALELFDEPPGGPQFGVETSEGALYGSVTGTDPAGIVKTIVAGGGCGGD